MEKPIIIASQPTMAIIPPWSDLGSFTTLPYDQGNLKIHTGLDSNGLGAGWFWDKDLDGTFEKILEPTFEQTLYFAPDGSAWTVTKAIFSFNESLVIGSNLDEIILEGANALSIRSTGDITVAHSLNGSLLPSNPHITGGTLTDGYDAFYADSANKGSRAGLGNLGGYGGGKGPGRGISSGSTYAGGASGGGGSNGGEGGPEHPVLVVIYMEQSLGYFDRRFRWWFWQPR